MYVDKMRQTIWRLLLAFAILLSVFYINVFYETNIESQQVYFVMLFATVTFAIDVVWLKHITRGLHEKLSQSASIADTLDVHFQKATKLPGLYPVIRQEVLVVFYGFFARYYTAPFIDNTYRFSYQKSSNANDVFWLVAVAQLPTLPFIHFFIEHQGNSLAAWFVTLITLWSVVYFYAQKLAVEFCPITIQNEKLKYRFGMSWHASIPLSNIKCARLPGLVDRPDYFEYFTSPFGSDKKLLLEFHKPVKFKGLYLTSKSRKKAIIAVDDPAALVERLQILTKSN